MLNEAIDWQKERPLINGNNQCWAQSLLLLLGEISELEEAAADYHDGFVEKEELAGELADVILFATTLLHSLGFDPEGAVRGKMNRNTAKYPASELQEGDYFEKMTELKVRWNGRKKTENIIFMSPARL